MASPVITNLKRLVVWTVAAASSAVAVGLVQLKGSGQTLRDVALAVL